METPETFLCLAPQTKNSQYKTSTADYGLRFTMGTKCYDLDLKHGPMYKAQTKDQMGPLTAECGLGIKYRKWYKMLIMVLEISV